MNSLSELKSLLNQHNKAMNDIKPLLKTMNKFGEQNQRLTKYTKAYCEFSENCQSLVRHLSSDELLVLSRALDIQAKILALKTLIPKIYSDLNGLMNEETSLGIHGDEMSTPEALEKNNNLQLNTNRTISKTGKLLQESGNAFAISVWKRVNQKLEGKDTDLEEGCSTQYQVRFSFFCNWC